MTRPIRPPHFESETTRRATNTSSYAFRGQFLRVLPCDRAQLLNQRRASRPRFCRLCDSSLFRGTMIRQLSIDLSEKLVCHFGSLDA